MLSQRVLALSARTLELSLRTVGLLASNPCSIEHICGRIPNGTSSTIRTPILDRFPTAATNIFRSWGFDGRWRWQRAFCLSLIALRQARGDQLPGNVGRRIRFGHGGPKFLGNVFRHRSHVFAPNDRSLAELYCQ